MLSQHLRNAWRIPMSEPLLPLAASAAVVAAGAAAQEMVAVWGGLGLITGCSLSGSV
jgi:hypothetical protein